MISDFINVNKKIKIPLYTQIYREIKSAIENGNLTEGEKLPSVRKLCTDLSVSKTTVENAYDALCAEGYLINLPKKGYFVENGLYIEKKLNKSYHTEKLEKNLYKYDFSGKGIDLNISNIKEWRKYIKQVLNRDYLLNTYSENQGEEELRKALAGYAFTTRGVNTTEDNIIVGSGSQTLIYILCGLLGVNKTVAIEKNTFPQAEQVFKDFNYKIVYIGDDEKKASMELIKNSKPDIILINPNFSSLIGKAFNARNRVKIINYAKSAGAYIIEDDYNGELRYRSHPTACLQSLDSDNVIYIGSFSKILLPSVRISYMTLPDSLLNLYKNVKDNYNQTTSKVEQLALSKYINDGKLEKHLRKTRRYYNEKSDLMCKQINKYFNEYVFNETSMYYEIAGNALKLKNTDIKVMNTSSEKYIRLNFSRINSELIEEGVEKIYKELKKPSK